MNAGIKRNLWWIISSIVLYIPIVILFYESYVELDVKLLLGFVSFMGFVAICASIGVIANNIKNTLLKIIWIVLGFVGCLLYLFCVVVLLVIAEPMLDEDSETIESNNESYREMICSEFEVENHLDDVVGLEMPEYKIIESECYYASMFPSETKYDVALSLCFPEGLTKSFWSEIQELASEIAPNPKYEGDLINKWDFGENNPNLIVYQCEDSSNVGYVVTFKPKCDTVLVISYKGIV